MDRKNWVQNMRANLAEAYVNQNPGTHIGDPPNHASTRTVEELEEQGFVGVYRDDSECTCSTCCPQRRVLVCACGAQGGRGYDFAGSELRIHDSCALRLLKLLISLRPSDEIEAVVEDWLKGDTCSEPLGKRVELTKETVDERITMVEAGVGDLGRRLSAAEEALMELDDFIQNSSDILLGFFSSLKPFVTFGGRTHDSFSALINKLGGTKKS
jgi:hypothetical protein